MIKTETMTIGSKEFIHTYSDMGYQMIQDGDPEKVYADAMDLVDHPHTYTEIETPDEEISDSEALAIITGQAVQTGREA